MKNIRGKNYKFKDFIRLLTKDEFIIINKVFKIKKFSTKEREMFIEYILFGNLSIEGTYEK